MKAPYQTGKISFVLPSLLFVWVGVFLQFFGIFDCSYANQPGPEGPGEIRSGRGLNPAPRSGGDPPRAEARGLPRLDDGKLAQESGSFKRAVIAGFEPYPLEALPTHLKSGTQCNWIALLCPDGVIASIYREYLFTSPAEIRLILAHGFVMYSGELRLAGPHHQVTLLAPKAIGPKLLQNFQT